MKKKNVFESLLVLSEETEEKSGVGPNNPLDS